MGASSSGSASSSSSAGKSSAPATSNAGATSVDIHLQDLELPPRRDGRFTAVAGGGHAAAAAVAEQLAASGMAPMPGPAHTGGSGGGAGGSAVGAGVTPVSQEIQRGGEALGQRAFRDDGLVGTETQQLALLAHYAELCEDFRRYQRLTRAEGAPQEGMEDGAQLLLLSGAPGTGKTRHAVSFAKALGLPLLLASPGAGGVRGGAAAGWAAQLRREVHGRDCVVFFDEIDQHAADENFASELRQFLDGVCQPVGGRVLLVGTTNRIDRLPEDVLHRAEVIRFDRPETSHLAEMWRGYAMHLPDPQLEELSAVSARVGATGRDVRHCASWAERRMAVQYLNNNTGMGYCHGAALASCPTPPLDYYLRCVKERAPGAGAWGGQWPAMANPLAGVIERLRWSAK